MGFLLTTQPCNQAHGWKPTHLNSVTAVNFWRYFWREYCSTIVRDAHSCRHSHNLTDGIGGLHGTLGLMQNPMFPRESLMDRYIHWQIPPFRSQYSRYWKQYMKAMSICSRGFEASEASFSQILNTKTLSKSCIPTSTWSIQEWKFSKLSFPWES